MILTFGYIPAPTQEKYLLKTEKFSCKSRRKVKIYSSILISFLCLFFVNPSFAQEYQIKLVVKNKTDFQKANEIVSIDDEFSTDSVKAYANAKQLSRLKKAGYSFRIIDLKKSGKSVLMAQTLTEMEDGNHYPTHDVYLQMMENFAAKYPNICRLQTLGNSVEGRPVQILKITDNPDIQEAEPEVFFTGQMHGDELVTSVIFLRLIDYLLSNYDKSPRITRLINETEIWINPLANPDGAYAGGDNSLSGATRSNANGVDLNRNFPNPKRPHPSHMNEPEVQMMIRFAKQHSPVFSVNTHSGGEVVNYPWDTWLLSEKKHPDHDWFEHIARKYADTVHNYKADYLTDLDNGITHGGEWYQVTGGRQDYMCYYAGGREITLELSTAKFLSASLLEDHWNYNRAALLDFLETAHYGFHGTVKDPEGNPLRGKITILNHDTKQSEVYADPDVGDYYRPIAPGTYVVQYSCKGFKNLIDTIVIPDWDTQLIKNVILQPAPRFTLKGNITESVNQTSLAEVKVEFADDSALPISFTDNFGNFTSADIYAGVHQIRFSKPNYISKTETIVLQGDTTISVNLSASNAESFEEEIPVNFSFSEHPWIRDSEEAREGNYCMRSGQIPSGASSIMQVEINLSEKSECSFFAKTSSEPDYDYLLFSINDQTLGKWSGQSEWEQYKFPLEQGKNVLQWTYMKDDNTDQYKDCAWVDFIELPEQTSGIRSLSTTVRTPLTISPNPACHSTEISFSLPHPSPVHLGIYNINGTPARILINKNLPQGAHTYCWNTQNENPGIYVCKLQSCCLLALKKIIVIR